jgi:alpha-tubulin suppressor-like RCC1 family protein
LNNTSLEIIMALEIENLRLSGNNRVVISVKTATPMASASPMPTPASTATPTPLPSNSASPTPSPTQSSTPTPSPSRSATPTPSPSKSPTPTPTPTVGLDQAYSLFGWGEQNVGTNRTAGSNSPVQTISGGTDWGTPTKSVYAIHYMTLKRDNTLWGWGSNTHGGLGDDTVINKSSPIQIVDGNGVGWSFVGLGEACTYAIDKGGRLWSWGRNGNGCLGLNDVAHRSSPVQVGLDTTWSVVTGGQNSVMAIKTNGTLWGWGYNAYGQLGNSTNTTVSSPVQIGSATTWSKISAGQNSYFAIKTDGTLWRWGRNFNGALGDGTTLSRNSPIQLGTDTWSNVQGLDYGALALKSNGELWSWGYNLYGKLGDGTVVNRSSPVRIGNETNWIDIAAGQHAGVGLKSDGSLWHWGYSGMMGDGSTFSSKSSPVQTTKADNLWISLGSSQRNFFCVRGVIPATPTPTPV